MPERCDINTTSALQKRLHIYRYQVAGRYVRPTDIVVDAACGTGFGRGVLPYCVQYIGLDHERPDDVVSHEFRSISGQQLRPAGDLFFCDDLSVGIGWLLPGYNVWISIETIEHLPDYSHLIRMAKMARRNMIITTPITPTKHRNPFHVHDFTREQVEGLFVDEDWALVHFEEQPGRPQKEQTIHGIFVFERVS